MHLVKQLNTLDVKINESVSVGDFPLTGRGVKATNNIYKGTLLMQIKIPSVINAKFIFETYPEISDFVAFCFPQIKIDVFDLMIIWLLSEKFKEDSKFQANIQIILVENSEFTI